MTGNALHLQRGRQALGSPGFWWMPGMLAEGKIQITPSKMIHLQVRVDHIEDGKPWTLKQRAVGRNSWLLVQDAVPVIGDDPATLGCLLAMARVHHRNSQLRVRYSVSQQNWQAYNRPKFGAVQVVGIGETEIDALLAALQTPAPQES